MKKKTVKKVSKKKAVESKRFIEIVFIQEGTTVHGQLRGVNVSKQERAVALHMLARDLAESMGAKNIQTVRSENDKSI